MPRTCIISLVRFVQLITNANMDATCKSSQSSYSPPPLLPTKTKSPFYVANNG